MVPASTSCRRRSSFSNSPSYVRTEVTMNVAPLWLADEPTDRREGATVAHGRNHPFVEDGPVGEPVDAVREVLQDPCGHIVAATHDDIGAERGDEGVISCCVTSPRPTASALN